MTAVFAFLRAHWTKLLPLAVGFAAGWWLHRAPPAPAVHEKLDTHATEQRQTAQDTTAQLGPVDRDWTFYGPPLAMPGPQAQPGAPRAPATAVEPVPCPIAATLHEHTGPSTVATHSTEFAQAAQDTHLDLTIKPSLPQWQAQVGLEDVLGARQVRLAARRRLFGPVWAEVSGVPAARSVGVALAVEF